MARIQARIDDAADLFADGKIDKSSLDRINAALRPRLTQAMADAATASGASGLIGSVSNLAEEWPDWSLTKRRAFDRGTLRHNDQAFNEERATLRRQRGCDHSETGGHLEVVGSFDS